MSYKNRYQGAVLRAAKVINGFTLPGAIHTSGIYPSSRLSESYVGQCWTPDQGGVYRVAGSGNGQVRGAKLATTVAEGAILGPELITNGGFDSDTWWAKNGTNTAITGGKAVVTNSDTSSNGVSRSAVVTVGSRYRITYTLVSISSGGFFPRIGSAAYGTNRTTPGTYTEDIVCAGDTNLRLYGTVTGQSFKIDNVSLREIIPVWIAPDDYPTRSIRTRFGTARVPTGTSVGMVSSPAFTNKVWCRKTNPTDTTNVTKGGDAAAVLSVVQGVREDFQNCIDIVGNVVDMSAICSSYKYYRLDNSVGSTEAYVVLGGPGTPNVVMHTARVFIKGGSGIFGQSSTIGGRLSFTPQVVFRQFVDTKMPATEVSGLFISANPGQRVDFILPEFVESSYLPADPIVPLTPAADTLAAFTRAAIYMEEDTAGVFPTVTEVAREYVQNNCFATLGAGGADVFAGWTELMSGSSTVTQELVDLPPGFTSACKLTVDGSLGLASVTINGNVGYPVSQGQVISIKYKIKAGNASGLKFNVSITNGVTPLYLSVNGISWGSAAEYTPANLPTSWSDYVISLPAIPSGYHTLTAISVTRGNGVSQSHLITGISIGDTGIQNPYSSAASLMSDGSVVPVVAGASWAQNFAVFGTFVPDAGGQAGSNIVASYIDANNTVRVVPEGSTGFSFYKRTAGSTLGPASSYIYTANAPLDYLCLQTIHGMAIRIRPHATMVWSAWSTLVTTNGKKPAPIGTKYQIGALNGYQNIAGKHPKVSIFELGNQASLTAYQDRAMLLAGRITG